jgi:nitrous oxidase accessory protein
MRALALAACLGAAALVARGAEWHVGAGQTHSGLAAAIAAAAPGDTITVHGGRYAEGSLQIAKPLVLAGIDGPVLDGEFRNEIITVSASDVAIRGFTLRNGGRSSTREVAGIRIESADRVTVADNRLIDCDYGIYLAKARDCEVLRNAVEGKMDRELNSGNGIHLWNCTGSRISGNRISGHRDGVYLEFSAESLVEDNRVEENLRYGLHFMSSHSSRYRGNRFSRNGAGVAVMYSRHVEMTGNVFEYSWGGSSYGLLIKDLTDSEIRGNIFHHNSTGVYSQGATRTNFVGNEFRENGWALRLLSNGAENTIAENNFRRNSFDVGTNGPLGDHRFARNYWDRYEGYDLNHDGVGDVPFRPVSLYSTLVERVPASVLLIRSFMMHLLDRAEKALPSLTPESVVDGTPAWRPHVILNHAADSPGNPP